MTTQPAHHAHQAHQAHPPRAARRRPTRGRRRTGYAVAALVDVLLLLMVNGWPGWEAVPFLADDFDRVVGILNVSFVVHGLAQLAYMVADPPWLRGLGDAVTSVIGIALMARMWQVWPFTTGDDWSGWGLALHVLLAVGIAGAAIAVLVGLVGFGRGLTRPAR